MTLIKAENRELTHSRYSSTKGIPTVKIRRPTARGYYLALTFGTLLSSQGADAQQSGPRGLSSLADCPIHTSHSDVPRSGVRSGALPGRRGAWGTVHEAFGSRRGAGRSGSVRRGAQHAPAARPSGYRRDLRLGPSA